MGCLFGFIFGVMDIEDSSLKLFQERLMKEENFCIPIGVILGGLSGLVASVIENKVNFIKKGKHKSNKYK